jgi:predicted phosphoribosyltransferase
VFANRTEAGRALGREVAARRREGEVVVVLGLARGGVTVAAEVARELDAPLDVLVVRKLGVPGHRELAMGALAAGSIVRNEDVIASLGIDEATLARVVADEKAVADQREREYRGVRAPVPLGGRTAVVVDDGLATGATARAAVRALRHRAADRPARVVLAVPVAPRDTLALLAREVDDVVCLQVPPLFYAVGEWYRDFSQVNDEQVRQVLAAHGADSPGSPSSRPSTG